MSKYIPMREVTFEEYLHFIKKHNYVIIENQKIEIGRPIPIRTLQPVDFKLESSTVWSFPERGKWATHYANAKYRGNWAPQVPRNLILKYSNPGETVLDAFVGSGTTLIECKLLGRNGIGVDVNYEAIMVAWDRLNFKYNPEIEKKSTLDAYMKLEEAKTEWFEPKIKLYHGDARNLDKIEDESIDLIATHPPYANIISYSKKAKIEVKGDLSKVTSVNEFIREMKKVAEEFYRVLKPGRYVAILIGDTRRHKHFVPISFRVMQAFLDVGFILKEDIIKLQHNMIGTIPWKKWHQDFHLIAHEHLFIFRKPAKGENIKKFKESMKWW
ncbi:DNA methyltransferase [Thermococcus sp. 2319x1]|uniref:DNA methyltransferase n=1 Tax=Thermococcus sp. 2319x1 TaxID=1674923 RepID=UPI0018D73681|nr:DNA methyltransferase [Thermococcus sp. 2319x1]